MSEQPVLHLSGVHAGYGGTPVVRDIDFDVASSSVVALLGPNGAGKTTLLRAACGIIPTTRGHIYLDGEEITRASTHRRARLGICHVPEGRGVFPSLTVRENLRMFAPKDAADDRMEMAVTAFPALAPRLRQTAGSLSGGEQQMLAMARAYISNPRLVIVDEASMGLAPIIVDKVFAFLSAIAEAGTSLLIVEQYVHRALTLCHRVYVLNHGEIVFQGTPDEIKDTDILERYLGAEVAAAS